MDAQPLESLLLTTKRESIQTLGDQAVNQPIEADAIRQRYVLSSYSSLTVIPEISDNNYST